MTIEQFKTASLDEEYFMKFLTQQTAVPFLPDFARCLDPASSRTVPRPFPQPPLALQQAEDALCWAKIPWKFSPAMAGGGPQAPDLSGAETLLSAGA